jgi:transcriptional regulator with GAF, ATPase, and Fis domain
MDVAPSRTIAAQVARLAPLETPVLLLGETGVGKGVVARCLHQGSRRRAGPFVHVDCGALAPGLFESELFGHERGAFTGAVDRHAGRFERARRGTLFLDEIGELAPALQAKLLHVLQERVFERVGGEGSVPFEARVVVATNRDLAQEVRGGSFRADLYFRIAVAPIRIPPLRERRQEIAPLVCEGLDRIKARIELALPRLGADAMARLECDAWPGNVRQLFNALERLAILHPGRSVGAAEVEAVLDEGLGSALPPPLRPERVVHEIPPQAGAADERQRLVAALRDAQGNVSRAARHLGMARTTLRRRLTMLRIEVELARKDPVEEAAQSGSRAAPHS